MFPHQIVAFQLKKNISSCEDELSILKKTNVAIKKVKYKLICVWSKFQKEYSELHVSSSNSGFSAKKKYIKL